MTKAARSVPQPDRKVPEAAQVKSLSEALEVTKKRIDWLENLKGDADARARLSEATGLELTIEELDAIIDATRREAVFIEKSIQMLLQGPQARMDEPVFWAEGAGDPSMVRNIGFGPSLLNLDSTVAAAEAWY